jgi:glycosyltransferase involved in cell wall biosynthesis
MRVAIIVPRYGPDVLGGAETQARGFAEEAVRQGWDVEVWTTCARSHYTWENVYLPGQEYCRGVLVRRFPVTDWDPDCQAELNIRIASRGVLSVADQYRWLESGMHSVPLYEHMIHHAVEFDVIVTLPYAMPLAHYAAWAAPERVVVWPCLHDEPFVYLEPVRLLLETVWGMMFNSPEESDLALKCLKIRPARCAVLGEGVTLSPSTFSDQTETQTNDLLYVGRLEMGKNLSLFYEYVQRYFAEGKNIRLVVLGGGPLGPPSHPAFEYRGFVSEEEKARTYASALALCQPSLNESFSLTIMESWLAARPVLVHGECAVTRGHVQRSKGGLWFHTYEEFVGAVEWLQSNAVLASRMGNNGRRYVLSNYTWPVVVERFECLVRGWRGSSG